MMSSGPEISSFESLPAWKIAADVWKSRHGYPCPWICDISPAQYAGLSKAGKRAYDKKRAAEWDASAKGYLAYVEAVVKAHEAGEVVRDEAHPDALQAIRKDRDEKARARRDAIEKRLEAENQITPENAVLGARVWHPMFGWGTIERVSAKSLRVACERGGTVTRAHKQFEKLNHDAMQGAIEAAMESAGESTRGHL